MTSEFKPKYSEPSIFPLKIYDDVGEELREISALVLLTLVDSKESNVVMVSGILKNSSAEHQLCYSSRFSMDDKKLPLDFERVYLSQIGDYRLMMTRDEIDADEKNIEHTVLTLKTIGDLIL